MRKSVVVLGIVIVFLGFLIAYIYAIFWWHSASEAYYSFWSYFWWMWIFYTIGWVFLIIGSAVSIVGVWLKPSKKVEVFVPVTPVLKIEKCPSCGLSIEEEGASFCPHCGAELK